MKAVILEANRIEKKLQVESGMVVVQDPPNPLHWEQAYFTLTTEGDDITTPPPNPPPNPPNPPPTNTDGLRRNKPGSVIDLTALSDNESPPTRVARAKANRAKKNKNHAKAEIVVKQEITDDEVVVKVVPNKGKEVKPAKDSAIGAGNLKVATKTYRHGEGNAVAKTMKAEAILTSIAEGLSPEAQEKREISRMNLLREAMHQERKDRVDDERIRELKLENQALKKEVSDLHRDVEFHRSRATEALTTLNLLGMSAGNSFTPVHGYPPPYTPATPAFTTDTSLYFVPVTDDQSYSVPATDDRSRFFPAMDGQSVEPEGIAGPGPQTMHYRQEAAEDNDSKIPPDE